MANQKTLLRSRLAQYANYHIDKLIANKLISLPLIFFETTENHNLLQRINSNIGNRIVLCFISIMDVIKYIIMLSGYTYLLFTLHWLLAFLLIVLLVPSFHEIAITSRKKYIQEHSQLQKLRRSQYLFSLFSSKMVQKEFKLFGHASYILKLWKKIFLQTTNEQYELEKYSLKRNSDIFALHQIVNALFIAGIVLIGRHKNVTIGDFVAYSQLLSMSISSIKFLSSGIGTIISQGLYISDLKKFITIPEKNVKKSLDLGKVVDSPEVAVLNISFKYPNSDTYILKNISFSISPGEIIAIVGDNGSGKSTLIKCLLGLYSVQEGKILIDGVDIDNIPENELSEKMTVLFQDFVKYELTIKENITLAHSEVVNQTRLKKTIDEAGISEMVDMFYEREDTALGHTHEKGKELSGGQWQRLALGRALYKDAQMVFLDEPTAALDPISEVKLINSFVDICKEKTAVIISHRLASCLFADKIIVLQEGEIKEIGNHQQLLLLRGLYYKMFHSQADSYHSKAKCSS
ncbi:ABC transporter ATP-binding protein [Paenibacillus popilliae]|nr:ABC transporter ATP-binding protein [Paenibacillus popilliae]